MVNIFSASVFGATFPNPTDVKLLNVKYKAVTYRDCKEKKRQTESMLCSFRYKFKVIFSNGSNKNINLY